MAEELKTGVHSPAQKVQPPLWKEVDAMTEKEQMTITIFPTVQGACGNAGSFPLYFTGRKDERL